MSSTSSSSARPRRRRSPAASSMSASAARRRRSFPELFDLNANPGDIGPPVARNLNFTPKSASIGLIQNLPGQLVASITAQYVERAPKPAELFSRGGARRHRHLRYRQSQSRHRDRQDDRDRIAQGDRAFPVRSHRLLHQIQRLHLPPSHRQHLRGCRLRRPRRSGRAAGTEPGDLFATRRDVPRRRVPEPVRYRPAQRRHLGHREPVRRGARHLQPTAPTSRASRRCAPAADCSGATPTG